MLLVMVVVGILLAITAPMIRTFTVGGGVTAGISIVQSQLRLARRYALSKRRKVALIMPGNISGVAADKRYASLRIAYVTDSNPPNMFAFDRWMEDSEWHFLPTGALVLEADDDIGVQTSGTYAKIPADDGFTRVDNVPLLGIGTGTASGVRAVVFTSTGKVTGPSRYVTIGDATFDGATWIIRNPANEPKNKSSGSQVTIEMELYTGNFVTKDPSQY
jgi:competence protein ComGC